MTAPDPPEEHGSGGGPPVPPDDRLWRHPSEVGWTAGMAASPPGPPVAPPRPAVAPAPAPRVRTPLLVAGSMLLGAGMAVLGVYAGGLIEHPPTTEVVERVEQPRAVSVDSGAFEVALHQQVLPAIARLEARDGSGRTTATAIAFRSDGHLLTTADAVAGADTISVTLHDGRTLEATAVGSDAVSDLAVVKVDATDLPTVLLGSVRDLQLGEPVFAIDAAGGGAGAPAVTEGVISSLGDVVDTEDGAPLHDMITTNTGTTVAKPGAALIDPSGAVIGIATGRREAGAVPVGTEGVVTRSATPIEYARSVAAELIDEGRVHHVWLGVEGGGDDDLGGSTGGSSSGSTGGAVGGTRRIAAAGGAVVGTLAPGGPAAAAGVQVGDVISAVDDVRVTDMSSLVVSLRAHEPGDVVDLTVERDGERRVLQVALTERPPL